MYSSRQIKEINLIILFMEVVYWITLVMFLANIVWVLFTPVSVLTSTNMFSILLSLIVWRLLAVLNVVIDSWLRAHLDIIVNSMIMHGFVRIIEPPKRKNDNDIEN